MLEYETNTHEYRAMLNKQLRNANFFIGFDKSTLNINNLEPPEPSNYNDQYKKYDMLKVKSEINQIKEVVQSHRKPHID